ncbi:MAG: hypothetical protein U0353_21670 [Sandaracinus sp.]
MIAVRRWTERGAILGLAGVLASCEACGGVSVLEPARAPSSGPIEGSITFGARASTHDGLTSEETAMPARHVDVTLLDATGHALASGQSDEAGHFTFPSTPGATSLGVTARIRLGAIDVATSRERNGESSYAAVIPLAQVARDGGHVHFADTAGEMAGALHIADTLLRGSRALEHWTGHALPPVFAYWGRGITTDWSYFRGEIPEGSGRFCLELLGGPLGEQSSTDTDEHDEGIILHELGHFVMNRLAGDSSIGGRHPPGALVDPGVAWEEGRATWFAMAVLAEEDPSREPFYRDTLGIVPTGSTRIDEDVEHPSLPRGLGSERTVAGVLWDLTDGDVADPAAVDAVDRDGDGAALGAAAVLGAMSRAFEEPDAFVALPNFLRFLVGSGAIEDAPLRAMLRASGEDETLLAASDEAVAWPITLSIGTPVTGAIDGLSDPSPSGAPAKPDNGIDAVRVHRVTLPRAGTLVVTLTIEGSGGPSDHTDLDVQLWSRRAEPLASEEGPLATHTIRRPLEAGTYVVIVRDEGHGNRARYTLETRLE